LHVCPRLHASAHSVNELLVIFIHHNSDSSKQKKKKYIEYELNINLNYHIGSHIMTKLNKLHLTTLRRHCDENKPILVCCSFLAHNGTIKNPRKSEKYTGRTMETEALCFIHMIHTYKFMAPKSRNESEAVKADWNR